MNTKLYVLGVMLRTAPALLPMACSPSVPAPAAPRRVTPWRGGPAAELPLPPRGGPGPGSDAPTHPCELITVMQVPCDPSAATCEYTYWECPEQVKPLRA